MDEKSFNVQAMIGKSEAVVTPVSGAVSRWSSDGRDRYGAVRVRDGARPARQSHASGLATHPPGHDPTPHIKRPTSRMRISIAVEMVPVSRLTG